MLFLRTPAGASDHTGETVNPADVEAALAAGAAFLADLDEDPQQLSSRWSMVPGFPVPSLTLRSAVRHSPIGLVPNWHYNRG